MIRNLFVVAGSAFLLCLLSFAGVAAVGGFDLGDRAWTFYEDGEEAEANYDPGPESTRDITWTAGERLVIDAPGQVIFTQAPEASVRLSGPKSVIDRVRLVDGRLTIDDLVIHDKSDTVEIGVFSSRVGSRTYAPSDGLRVLISAPDVRDFQVNSVTDLEIRDYDQPSLTLTSSGPEDIRVAGRTNAVSLNVSGAGDVDLSDLEAADATVVSSGSGSVRAGPTSKVEVTLSGSGDVDLTRRPATLTQTVTGTGEVNQ